MKKLLILILALIAVLIVGYYAVNMLNNKGKSDTELIDFAIKDIESVDQLIISDSYNNVLKLIKKGDTWTTSNGDCIQQANVLSMVEALKNIQFKGYLPEATQKEQLKRMIAKNLKVEIFTNGSWNKTWYIGNTTQDHYGQIMLLETADDGRSDSPVVMKLKNLSGFIEPRFYADVRKMMCQDIFSLSVNDIKKVDIKFNEEKPRSFSVENANNEFIVKQQGKELENIDQAMALRYLNHFKDLNFSSPNYTLNKTQIDSVKRSEPFAVLTLTEKNGKTSKLRMFKIPSEDEIVNEFGNMSSGDAGNFWCELPNKTLVKCQYFHFDNILRGHVYFPMDLTELMNRDKS